TQRQARVDQPDRSPDVMRERVGQIRSAHGRTLASRDGRSCPVRIVESADRRRAAMGDDEEARQVRDPAARVDVAITPAAPGPVPVPYPNVEAGGAEPQVVQLIDR